MKKKLSLLLVLLFATSAFALDNPWDKKLPFKSAIINYKVSGTMSGEKTIYVKDYGKTTVEYSNTSMKMLSMTQQQKEIIITTPDWQYTIDLVENTGTKQANPKKFMRQEFNNLPKTKQKKVVKNAESLGISTIEGMNGKLQKNAAEILGYKCDKVNLLGTIVYTISGTGLPLKIEGNMMGMQFNQVAINIKKGSVPSSKFELPSNIRFEHNKQADQMMQAQAKTAIQNLLEGKRPESIGAGNQMGGTANDPNQLTPEMQEQMQQMMKIFNKQGD